MAAARRVFERDGYFGARVADITAEAGVAHGSFYTYFASRQDVFVAVLREVGEQFRVAVAVPPGEPRRGVLATLDRANRRYLEAYRANSVIWALAEQVATMDEEIHRIRLRGRIEHVERVAKTIRRWQDHGLADRDIDPRTTAGALVSMLSNFAYWWLAGGDSYDPETAAADGFIALPNAAQLTPDEEVDMVRVELPRSSMIALGYPVRADQASENVEADVVLGADGLARAVRFVDE